ncbi:recombinase family protein [uncultured Oscillibacter sp.]|uniref:recombinase family protein n=1 Tax=uncultured Oscillibacter sp. TaxID=876091 RepID=UPI0025E31294|nr:recombinase family protein [uncultured Oscillibacter sp.]
MSKRIDIQQVTVKKPLVEQPLRVAVYCRVSTDRGEQLGSLEKGTGYQQMIKDCKNGTTDLVLAKSISRLGRDTLTTMKSYKATKKHEYRRLL